MAIAKRRRIRSAEDARAFFVPRAPDEAAALDLTQLPEEEREEVLEQLLAKVRRRTGRDASQAPSGPSGVAAWLLDLADEPDVVGEFVTLVFVPRSPTNSDVWIAFGDLRQTETGNLALRQLSLVPYSEDFGKDGVTYAVWQTVKPPQLLRAIRAEFADVPFWLGLRRRLGEAVEPGADEVARRAAEIAGPTRGRPRLSDEDLVELVDAYLEAQNDRSRTLGIYETVRKKLGLESPETVKSRLREATLRELITEGKRGSANRRRGARYAEVKAALERERAVA